MYLGNNYVRAFHGEWNPAWPRLQIVLLCPSWVSTVHQEMLLSLRARLLVPLWHVLICSHSLFYCSRTHCCY